MPCTLPLLAHTARRMFAIKKIEHTDRSFDEFVSSCLTLTSWGSRRNDIRLPDALSKSKLYVCLMDVEPIGFIRIVTDGAYFGYVSELFVREQWRHHGIGTMLVETALDAPEHISINQWLLISNENSVFFEKHGFREVQRGRVFSRRRKVEVGSQ